MPKSYGEAKTFFNQEAHIYYFLAQLEKHENNPKQYNADLEKAAEYKAAVSEISLFRALALKELGKSDEANAVLEEMIENADNLINNCDVRTYHGVGSPSPMPFELDIVKNNLVAGNILKAYALYGMEKYGEAEICIRKAAELDADNFAIYAYGKISGR